MTTKSSTRRTNVTGLNAREPHAEEWALPKSVESGNLGLNKAVIRCRCSEEFPGVLDARRHLPRLEWKGEIYV
jgi:hypothetical protein